MNVTETEVIKIWQHEFGRKDLADSDGIPLEVIYPGRRNDSRGADFRDAVVASAGQRREGCIEVHARVSGWKAHGHHRDPVYNQVILHVAWEPDRAGRTPLQDGRSVPTLILKRLAVLDNPAAIYRSALCCQIGEHDPELDSGKVLNLLEEAGAARLRAKASRYEDELTVEDAGQSLYAGFLEALGYTQNKAPFRELARRIPLARLEEIVRLEPPGRDATPSGVQRLLLGRAGLLDPQPEAKTRPADLKLNWELFKVRPGNNPVLRILALGCLLLRWRSRGLLESLLDLVRQTSAERSHMELEAALIVDAEERGCGPGGYARDGLGLPPQSAEVCAPAVALLGRQRAAEIVINVLLPFVLAWSRRQADSSLAARVGEIYRRYARLESNSIERHMLTQLGVSRTDVNLACRQQGLIHIYKTLCTQGKCRECGLASARI